MIHCYPYYFDLFQFNSSTQFSPDSPGFVAIPSLKDKIHVVVIVMDATSVDIFPPAIIDKIKILQAKVNQKGKITHVFNIVMITCFSGISCNLE